MIGICYGFSAAAAGADEARSGAMNRNADGSSDADGPQDGEETGGSVERKKALGLVLRRCPIGRSACFRTVAETAGRRFCRRKFVRTYVSNMLC